MQSIFESMGGIYTQSGDYLIPNIEPPAFVSIGRWGRQRRKYLMEHHEAYFYALLLTNNFTFWIIAQMPGAFNDRAVAFWKKPAWVCFSYTKRTCVLW